MENIIEITIAIIFIACLLGGYIYKKSVSEIY